MNEIKLLPLSVIKQLEEAGISHESEIFYENNQWVYQEKKLTSINDPSQHENPIGSLGPFEIRSVDISLVLSRSISKYNITMVGTQKFIDQEQPIGTFSPLAQITLQGCARSEANIPEDATHFCWLYPPHPLRFSDDVSFASFEEMNLLKIGGFAYFKLGVAINEEPQLLRVNSLIVSGENGLVFDGPYSWLEEYTDHLWTQNRFHPVTLPSLREKGARYFAFINPSEPFLNAAGQTAWIASSNGTFVYLFNDDHSRHLFDCYFTISDNCLGVAPTDD